MPHLRLQVHVEIERFKFILSFGFSAGVSSHSQEVDIVYSWHFYGRLKAEKNAFPGSFLWLQGKQVLAFVCDTARRHFVVWVANKHFAECALPRAILAHDGGRLAGSELQVHAVQHLCTSGGDLCMQVFDIKQDIASPRKDTPSCMADGVEASGMSREPALPRSAKTVHPLRRSKLTHCHRSTDNTRCTLLLTATTGSYKQSLKQFTSIRTPTLASMVATRQMIQHLGGARCSRLSTQSPAS